MMNVFKKAFLLFCVALTLSSCALYRERAEVQDLADRIWAFSQTHPDGFTLHVPDCTEPAAGISVSYAATQNSHSRKALPRVIVHARKHDGYVGGWLDAATGRYYFDSTRLFPEDRREEAVSFGRKNRQLAVYVLSTGETIQLKL